MMTIRYTNPLTILTFFAALAVAACGHAHEDHDHGAEAEVEKAADHSGHDHGDHDHGAMTASPSADSAGLEFTGDPYPLSYCVVTGDPLDAMGEPVSIVHEGRHIQFCCDSCRTEFTKDPAKWIEKIDREIVEQQIERYPLETCMVSGEKLGAMGAPVNIVAGNRLVRLCCGGCEKAVRANPEKFIDQLDTAAADAQRADYPLESCVVSGDRLGGAMGKPVDIVYAGRLVRLCCESCKTPFNETPHAFLKKLDEAEGGS